MNNTINKIQEIKLSGIPASPGIAIGTALVLRNRIDDVEKRSIEKHEIDSQFAILEYALEKTKEQIIAIKNKVLPSIKSSEAQIFDVHILILDDTNLINSVKEEIKNSLVTADYAFFTKIEVFLKAISDIEDTYFKEKAADIKDVSSRVIFNMYGREYEELTNIPGERIIVSPELSPSDTVSMNRENLQALVAETGSRTSHAAIIARSIQVPAVVALKPNISMIHSGDLIIVDGYQGVVIVNPSSDTLSAYMQKEIIGGKLLSELKDEADLLSLTADGRKIKLSANIELIEDIQEAVANKADGVGLYRTEYLFLLKNELPDEETQFNAYKSVVTSMHDKLITIRTLDLGGDKIHSKLNYHIEKNPFLGFRAIRLCLANPELFRIQLRAILRASAFGKVRVMFPMISSIEEVKKALFHLAESKKELDSKGVIYDKALKVGIMIETPSSALIADKLAPLVDFFSLGTNDLVQYTMVVDRDSEKVAYLYQPSHPAVLKLIKNVADAAIKHNIDVSICGEMAGDPQYTPLLIGLGINEFSMCPISINVVRKIIRESSFKDAEKLAECALEGSSSQDVMACSMEYLKSIVPDIYNIILKA